MLVQFSAYFYYNIYLCIFKYAEANYKILQLAFIYDDLKIDLCKPILKRCLYNDY